MSDTTRQPTPDERVSPNPSDLLESTPIYAQTETSNLAHNLENVTKKMYAPLTPCLPSTHPETQPNPQTLLNQLVNALNSPDENIRTPINILLSTWQATNHKGTPLNKATLRRSSWGDLREADDLQALQQAILTSRPPPNHTVTHYATYITTSISMGSAIKRHAIRNACNDDHLPHPLHNDTTIFNIHHKFHYTILIASNTSYY
jgi:hypothetical protein